MSTIAERVERGAALLDEKQPGWWRKIDLDRLNLSSPWNCVAGQLGGSTGSPGYLAVIRDMDIANMAGEIRYGFEADDDYDGFVEDEYVELTAAWHDLITARRAAAEVPA